MNKVYNTQEEIASEMKDFVLKSVNLKTCKLLLTFKGFSSII